MNHKQLVSVIIPTYNSARTLRECLVSIKNQTYQPVEIIVVDEFSSDDTPTIAKQYGVLYSMRGERSIARNSGARKAKGAYLLFIDSDMKLNPTVIKKCVEKSQEKAAVVIPEKSIGTGFWSECRILERSCYYDDDIVEAARFFPRSLFLKMKGYDESMVGVEDWDMHQRIIKAGYPIRRISSFIIHNEGTIKLFKTMKKKMYYGRVFKKYKQRHPEAFRGSFLRTSYLRHYSLLLHDPIHACGMIVLKLSEGIALLAGMYSGK